MPIVDMYLSDIITRVANDFRVERDIVLVVASVYAYNIIKHRVRD